MAPQAVASQRYLRGDLSPLMKARLTLIAWQKSFAEARSLAARFMRATPVLRLLLSLLEGITTFGWSVLSIGVTALLLGRHFVWTELHVLGVIGVGVVLLSLLASMGRSGYDIELQLERTRVSVGEDALGEVIIANPTKRPLPTTTIELPVGAGAASFTTGRIPVAGEHRESFSIAAARRGVVTVGPATSVRGDALGLIRRTYTWSQETELFIHPRTTTISLAAIGFIRDIEGASTQDLSSSDVSFHALRDYTPGDDRRNVHWRTTARTGKLMVRQFEETRRAHLLIIVDVDQDAWGSEEEFECGISAVASLARAAMSEAKEVSILTQAGGLPTSSLTHTLDSLAGISPLLAADRLPELTRKAGVEIPHASASILITGRNTTATTLQASLASLPLNMMVTGVRIDLSDELSLRTLGGFTIISAPTLEDVAVGIWKALG